MTPYKKAKRKADEWFSAWFRKSQADKNGHVICYTCDKVMPWRKAQTGHYVHRGRLCLRFEPRNCRIQCYGCNITKNGNYREYHKRMTEELGERAEADLWNYHKTVKFKTNELEELAEHYKNLFNNL